MDDGFYDVRLRNLVQRAGRTTAVAAHSMQCYIVARRVCPVGPPAGI